jgi:hypothetical protein
VHGYNLPDMDGTDTLPHDVQQAALELCKGNGLLAGAILP